MREDVKRIIESDYLNAVSKGYLFPGYFGVGLKDLDEESCRKLLSILWKMVNDAERNSSEAFQLKNKLCGY